MHLTSLYWLYTASRTFSNTFEAAVCSIALYYWPLSRAAVNHLRVPKSSRAYRMALFAAWLAVLIRPTSLVLWSFLGMRLVNDALHCKCFWRVIREPVWIGYVFILRKGSHYSSSLVLGAGFYIDSMYYDSWSWTPLNFVRENLWNSVSSFYGMNSWHWYFSVGIPSIVTIQLPYVAIGWWHRRGVRDPASVLTLFQACVWTLLVCSCLHHKETRFLQPLVPWLHLAAAIGMEPLQSTTSVRAAWSAVPRWIRALLFVQVPIVAYVCAFHARAQIHVMSYIHMLGRSASPPKSIGFLMPCHSTPWQSHMHLTYLEASGDTGDTGLAWFLACPPPQRTRSTYWDQTDFFFHDPLQYINTRFPPVVDPAFPAMSVASFTLPDDRVGQIAQHTEYDLGWRHPWPSHLVLFSSLLDTSQNNVSVGERLSALGYRPKVRFWNSFFHPDEHRRGDIVVLEHYYSTEAFAS